MTLRKKVYLLIFSSLVFFLASLFIFSEIQSKQNNLMMTSASEQQDLIINNEINGRADDLKQIVTDYTNWDDLIDYLNTKNQAWALNNIATIINSFRLHSVGVYNLEQSLVYGFGDMSDGIIGDSSEKTEILKRTSLSGFIHYYRVTDEGILEVSGATLHRTLDTSRTSEPYGFFYITKLWDKAFISELSMITGSSITLKPYPYQVQNTTENNSLITLVSLHGANQEPMQTLVFDKPNKFLASFHRMSHFVLYFLATLLVFVLSVFFYVLYRWVRVPLRIISDSLKAGETTQLGSLLKNKDEFSQIAGLVIRFNKQRKQLEAENAERKLMQQQVAEQNELLYGLAEASSHLLTNESLQDAISEANEAIVRHTNLDRMFIFKSDYNSEKKITRMIRIYDWIQPGIAGLVNADEYKELPVGTTSWFARIQEGQVINGKIEEYGQTLRPLLERQLVKSMVVVPIRDPQEHTFWGFAGFADCTSGRSWSIAEETAFTMLSHNIAGAIRRNMSQLELKEAMELARAADKAKSNFLASMSHEIRTPMNGVIGMTSLLMQSDLSPAQRELVETIETSGESLLNIINEILDFSKIESGNMVLEESAFDLRRCIEDVLDLMAPKIFEKSLELIYYIDPKINDFVFGDGFRLRQILVNLLGNAVKFTDSGEILVQVTVNYQADKTVILEFSVKDTGIGIPADKIDTLFTPFTQVDASTTRKYGGTGLGLAISTNLALLMDGQLWVESTLGKGSDFRFTMRTHFESQAATSLNISDKLRQLQHKRVLVVDDNFTNRRILQLQFDYWKIEAVAVSSGKEALALLNNNETFDVAILDMQMPDMDGEMLAREIRKKFSKAQLPLIMLTSIGYNYRSPEVQQLFAYYVNKPVKHSQLADILYSVFIKEENSPSLQVDTESDLKATSVKYPFEILVAEDNFINQKLVRKLFEVLGYKTDLAANGYEAIDSLKRKPYHIIFMDVQMPEMDGLEATRVIKEHWKNKAPVIIAMTANAMQGDREKCLESGMDDYISKPLRLEDILRVVNHWGASKEILFLDIKAS